MPSIVLRILEGFVHPGIPVIGLLICLGLLFCVVLGKIPRLELGPIHIEIVPITGGARAGVIGLAILVLLASSGLAFVSGPPSESGGGLTNLGSTSTVISTAVSSPSPKPTATATRAPRHTATATAKPAPSATPRCPSGQSDCDFEYPGDGSHHVLVTIKGPAIVEWAYQGCGIFELHQGNTFRWSYGGHYWLYSDQQSADAAYPSHKAAYLSKPGNEDCTERQP